MKTSDKLLHEKFQEYGRNAREWMRKCILMLPEIEDARIWEKKGFSCIQEYAGKLAGMGRHTVNDGLRILKRTANMPNIRKVIEEKGINIIKPIETLLTIENEKFWAEKASEMSMHALEAYVRATKIFDTFAPRAGQENPEKAYQQAISNFCFEGGVMTLENLEPESPPKTLVPMELSPETLQKLEKLKGQSTWNELFAELLEEREDQLEDEKPVIVFSESRYIPIAIFRWLLKRTNGTCAFPHCNKPFDEIHHTLRFSQHKMHDPDHMEILCETHHALAHHGLIDNEDCSAENWRVLLKADTSAQKFEVDRLVLSYRNRL